MASAVVQPPPRAQLLPRSPGSSSVHSTPLAEDAGGIATTGAPRTLFPASTTGTSSATPLPNRDVDRGTSQGNIFGRAWLRMKEILGYAGPSRSARRRRRELVGILFTLLLALAQAPTVVILTAFAAVRPSPQPPRPGDSQWDACTNLGVLNMVWLGRLVLRCYLCLWLLRRRRARRRSRRTARVNRQHIQTPAATGDVPSGDPAPAVTTTVNGVSVTAPTAFISTAHRGMWAVNIIIIKLDPLFVMIWFALALMFFANDTCLAKAPLIFAASSTILFSLCAQLLAICIMIFCTIVLMRPSDPPTIKKLSQADVDRIPLVLYIPPPPEDHLAKTPINTPQPASRLSVPASAPSQPVSKSKRHRFVFLRPSWLNRRSATARTPVEDSERGAGEDNARSDGGGDGDEWDQTWERGAHPFVRLPENLATCGICLLEFEAPRRLNSCRSRLAEDAEEGGEEDDDDGEELEMGEMPTKAAAENEPGEKVAVELPQPVDKQTVQSAESGSGDAPEPLRLLSCGHAYHKDCVDPWLVQKSGRCPYCSAPAVIAPRGFGRRRG